MAQIKDTALKGVYDIHIHASPSIFERWGNAEQTAEICQAAGMSGIAFKAHHGSTVELANHLNAKFRLDILGGVVLNYFVGGLNPYAVDACCALGGKFVWLPTIHAAAHEPLGRFVFQDPKTDIIPKKGIQIANEKGLVRSMYEILEILHNKQVVLATGHVAANEIKELLRVINKQAYNVRVLINHVFFFSPVLDEADINALKNETVWFEVSHFTQKVDAAPIQRMAQIINNHPDAKWLVVSDSGQKNNIAPHALKDFRNLLLRQGVSRRMLYKMMVTSPQALLY